MLPAFRPLFIPALAFLLGILAASALPGAAAAWPWLAGAALAAWLIPRLARRALPPRPTALTAALLALALGGWRGQAASPVITPEHIAYYNEGGGEWAVTGVLARLPDERDGYANLWVSAESIRSLEGGGPQPVHGNLLARVAPGGAWEYGDRLTLRGALATPPENETFSYRAYLAQRGVFAYMPFARAELAARGQGNPLLARLYAVKARSLLLTARFWPQPESSLLAGILLGVEGAIPRAVQEAFNRTGTSHVIAISGFNITLVAGLLVGAFSRWWGPRRGALAAALGIAAFTVLVGAEASVVRAALMGGLTLLARQTGRRQDGLNSLALVAAAMAAANPLLLWDVGFQLSFAATLGLVLHAEPMQAAFTAWLARRLPPERARGVARPVADYLLLTLAAQFTALPVILYHFQRLSLVSIPANVAILPAQPPILVLGGLALLAGLVWPPLGHLPGYAAWPFAAYTIRAVEAFDRLGGSWAVGRPSLAAVALFYVGLLGITLNWEKVRPNLPAMRPGLAIGGLAVTAALVWQAALRAPDGLLHATFLDVGNGEAILIRTPEGRYVLLNGGLSATRLGDGLGRRLPLFGPGLDALVAGGVRSEALGGLPPVLERYPPEQALWAGNRAASRASRDLEATLVGLGVSILVLEPGKTLDLGQGARLETLAAGPRGGVFLLAWGDFRALLPLGLDAEMLADLDIEPVTALLLAEEGYAPLNPPEWLAAANPQLVILSVAAGNADGLPDPAVLAALAGRTLLRTDLNGWIEIATDGAQMWVETER
jgi:competence protein ComEC